MLLRTIRLIMAEKPACAQCGKDAIGSQSFGCRVAFVCQDHAYSMLLALKPGEKYISGECCFERFDPAGSGKTSGLPATDHKKSDSGSSCPDNDSRITW